MSEMFAVFSGPLAVPCIICLITGIVLLLVELCLPGFGAPGILGILSLFAVVVMQFIGNSLTGALAFTLCMLILVLILLILFLHSFKKGLLSKSPLVNRSAVKKSSGKSSDEPKPVIARGSRGTALTALRPAGIVEIDGNRINAETDGTFLPAGTIVEVTGTEGLSIFVRSVPE
ncbi:MAG: hypothetical protein IJJ92_05020 [Clostridia bacterium]|nr:hypothetical protein [Clostridia bacterium]